MPSPGKVLLGPNGQPISTSDFNPQNTKAKPPKLGTSFGNWAGRDIEFLTLPGGGVVQFDLSKLTLADYRTMRDHYQVNASLAVLSFMQHQSDFKVICDDKKIADFCNDQLHEWWTDLNRAMSTANWAGFSPTAIEWDNDYEGRRVVISKVKDLLPEECRVHWKLEEGYAPPGKIKPKFRIFDGIDQLGAPYPIPTDNSFWYPMLMENGDYYGKKMLRPAFTSWFFSILVHLFANRYYERFGEPVPVGRAPFDESVDVNGVEMPGNQYMLQLLMALRSRSAVVLPNEHSFQTHSGTGKPLWDYSIEYLESQMRGADFERYMTRLDEEISIGLFTPILLLRTADVGSYNLGQGHMQMYLWMLNSMNEDRAKYINRYLLSKMADYNFGVNTPRPKIQFRKLGNTQQEMIRDVLVALINKDKAEPDIEELGQMVGMTLKEIKQTLQDPNAPGTSAPGDPKAPPAKPGQNGGRKQSKPANLASDTAKEMAQRVRGQVEGAFRSNNFGSGTRINMGYKHRFERSLAADGIENPIEKTNRVFSRMDNWLADVVPLGSSEFSEPASFMALFERVLENEVEEAVASTS
jgi:hypothetical protein